MGTTYAAIDVNTNQRVAIKELSYVRVADLKALELFHREAEVLKQLQHPAIPRYLDDFELESGKHPALYLVQEFIEGANLAAEMETHRYDEAEVHNILEELAGILDYLHGLRPPVIHRDIKPSNVIRRASNRALVLVDFGSVRDAFKDARQGGSTVSGTFGYMAPEQFRGDATPATDYYALGALALALLSRQEPSAFLGLAGQLEWASCVRLNAGTAELLQRLLAHNPADRLSSADELRAITRYLRGSSRAVEIGVLKPRTSASAINKPRRRGAWPSSSGSGITIFGRLLIAVMAFFFGGFPTALGVWECFFFGRPEKGIGLLAFGVPISLIGVAVLALPPVMGLIQGRRERPSQVDSGGVPDSKRLR
ncbi:MAG: serine/threonine protein kinase [Deltaproteobacteria bacterium]|nr:serine/threonine protein kinase [Deltaproteobacteria bacterium]